LNKLVSSALGALLLVCGACAKKEPKPLHTEPWLAHPPASAAASADAGVPAARYAITEQSQIHFELASSHGTLHGSLTRLSGELSVSTSDLSASRGQVQVDLSSLTLSQDGTSDDGARLAQARNALGVTDAGSATATFELSSLEDVSPAQLDRAPDSDGGASFTRRARATAVGNLLLHGFRVVRRAPLEAEFSFTGDRSVPSSLLIRSRAPFVISLETHEIRVSEAVPGKKARSAIAARGREARVSVELYGRKID
jgi:YceI-like domain